MNLSRTKGRKTAMIILYQILLYQKNNMEYNIDEVINENLEQSDEYVETIVKNIVEDIDNLSVIANRYLDSWPLNRLGVVDQAIILIGIYELLSTTTPDIVCINEAIELSKEYSDENVSKIINATLDNVYHKELKR